MPQTPWSSCMDGTRGRQPGMVPTSSTLARLSKRLLTALRSAPGMSWYGPVNCLSGREPVTRLFVWVHKFADCATAMIYCDESTTGPAEILVVLPAQRRSRLRPEFVFEFLSFVRFLGAVDAGAELHVHDAIT